MSIYTLYNQALYSALNFLSVYKYNTWVSRSIQPMLILPRPFCAVILYEINALVEHVGACNSRLHNTTFMQNRKYCVASKMTSIFYRIAMNRLIEIAAKSYSIQAMAMLQQFLCVTAGYLLLLYILYNKGSHCQEHTGR